MSAWHVRFIALHFSDEIKYYCVTLWRHFRKKNMFRTFGPRTFAHSVRKTQQQTSLPHFSAVKSLTKILLRCLSVNTFLILNWALSQWEQKKIVLKIFKRPVDRYDKYDFFNRRQPYIVVKRTKPTTISNCYLYQQRLPRIRRIIDRAWRKKNRLLEKSANTSKQIIDLRNVLPGARNFT